MKARLIGAVALAVCAPAVSASFADSPKKSLQAEPRLASEELPRGRFKDERYLLSPSSKAGSPFSTSSEAVWLEGPVASPVAPGVVEPPTGLIDEILYQEDAAWCLPAVRVSRFPSRGAGLADWSGLAITSTVGE